MRTFLTLSVTVIFAVLAALHLYWALGGKLGIMSAVPSTGGVPAFVPGAFATALVAAALLAAAIVVAAVGGAIAVPLPRMLVTAMGYSLAFVLAARAIGDFRLVGFFKRTSDSPFAQLDTAIYSPLCALLALAILVILFGR